MTVSSEPKWQSKQKLSRQILTLKRIQSQGTDKSLNPYSQYTVGKSTSQSRLFPMLPENKSEPLTAEPTSLYTVRKIWVPEPTSNHKQSRNSSHDVRSSAALCCHSVPQLQATCNTRTSVPTSSFGTQQYWLSVCTLLTLTVSWRTRHSMHTTDSISSSDVRTANIVGPMHLSSTQGDGYSADQAWVWTHCVPNCDCHRKQTNRQVTPMNTSARTPSCLWVPR